MTKRRKSEGTQVRVPINGSWTGIPNGLLRDTNLSRDERLLGALLYVYAGNTGHCFPLQQELADLLGVERRTVQTWITRLKKARYIAPQRTVYGNVYSLQEPQRDFNHDDPTIIHDDHRIAPDDPVIACHAITGSHASLLSQTHDSDSSSSESPPPTPEGDDDGNDDSIRAEESDTARFLRDKLKIVVWKELTNKLRNVPYGLVERRVNLLLDQGKTQGIIVKSLREIPFEPGQMDEAGPLPSDRKYWQEYGFTFADDQADEQCPERGDPELAQWFKETGI